VATVCGLGALVDRSISAADAIGKTADKIGVGVEALQELRFAAKASGVEQQTLDMPLQRFTRRAAEAAQGTGEATDATRTATCAGARTCGRPAHRHRRRCRDAVPAGEALPVREHHRGPYHHQPVAGTVHVYLSSNCRAGRWT
jgi:hypothetical protein